jgi:hypothetical protein
MSVLKKKPLYDSQVSLQKNNQETSGEVKNQNEHHNAKKEALGPNTKR